MPILTRHKNPKCPRDTSGYKGRLRMTIAMERILAWKILPRLMMLVMTIMYVRCIEWALSMPDISTQQASLISVVTGAMTGTIAVWLSHEK
jgi:hypothetical protein